MENNPENNNPSNNHNNLNNLATLKLKQEELKKYRDIFLNKRSEVFSKVKSINYFWQYNLVKKEPNFCPLFAKDNTTQKCHALDKIMCWNCYCSHYDIEYLENGKLGRCLINSKDAKYTRDGILDCSDCVRMH